MNLTAHITVFIASSWKQRERVQALADALREIGLSVYDFTDPRCRKTPGIPPEKYPEKFDPTLPCGIDATADWAYAFAKGKETYIVGHPYAGERSPVHRKANGWFADEKKFAAFLQSRHILPKPQKGLLVVRVRIADTRSCRGRDCIGANIVVKGKSGVEFTKTTEKNGVLFDLKQGIYRISWRNRSEKIIIRPFAQ